MRSVVIGGLGVDVNVALPEGAWPLPDADTTFAQVSDPSLGHAGSGVAVQAAELGAAVTACDVLGDDVWGQFVRREMAHHAVLVTATTHDSGTRRSVNLVRPDGSRQSLHDPRHPYDMEVNPTLWRGAMEGADWVHVVIVNWARHALRDARERGLLTSTDLQDWTGTNDHHREFAYGADVVFCSAVNLSSIEATVSDIFSNGVASLVVITRGPKGALVFERGVPKPTAIPALTWPGRDIVDTNGAGDSFCATFMISHLRGKTIEESGRRAALAAAYSASFPGTNKELVSKVELSRQAEDMEEDLAT